MKVKNLSFQHTKQAPYFFKDLSFKLDEGLIHALHGKNGVGKSILLQILSNNLDKENILSGEILAEKVELLHQQFDQTLVSKFTFLENLHFGSLGRFPALFSSLRRLFSPLQEDTFHLLKKFHINIHLPVYKLSGGQRQILSLLMKLHRNAKVLLLDEPTAALDEQNAILVFEFLKALKGVTLLVVCHDKELITTYTTGKHLYMEMDREGTRVIMHS